MEVFNKEIEVKDCHNFLITGCDTDAISFNKPDGKPFSKEEQQSLLNEINTLLPEKMIFEDDGNFKVMLVVKAKNYATQTYKKKDPLTIKGSALKASMKEVALKEFTNDLIHTLINKRKDHIFAIYTTYVQEILSEDFDISRWSSKKTVTESVLNPKRTTEEKLLKAIESKGLSQGDKFKVYFKTDDSLACEEDYNNDHNVDKLLEKLYKTLSIFSNVIDIDAYPNYKIKKNKILLESL